MKKILNIFLAFVVFYLATNYFGEYVTITSMKEILITTLLWVVSGYMIIGIIILCLLPAIVGDLGKVVAFALISTIMILSSPIRLYLIHRFYDGFSIHGGFIVYIILSVVLSILSLGDTVKKD